MTVPLPVHKHHTVEGAVDCHVQDCDVYEIQRAQRAAVPPPRYTGAVIYCCPDCFGDLEHEGGDGYWCPACHQSFYFTQVALYDAEGLDD